MVSRNISLVFSLLFSSLLFSQTTPIQTEELTYSPFSSAVSFVSMPADSRFFALGSSGIGSIASPNSTFWSIAKTTRLEDEYSASMNYSPLLQNIKLDNYYLMAFTATKKVQSNSAASLFLKYLNIDKIDITSNIGEKIAQVKPFQMMAGLGYAIPLSSRLSIGLGGKYIRSDFTPGYNSTNNAGQSLKAANAFALDLSIDYEKTLDNYAAVLNWGVSISTLGNKIDYTGDGRYSYMPANIGVGVGYRKDLSKYSSYHFSLDINKFMVPSKPDSKDSALISEYYSKSIFSSWINSFYDAKGGFWEELREIIVNLGVEYSYKDLLYGRIGYIYNDPKKFNSSILTLGLGVRYKFFDFDIAYGVPTYVESSFNSSPQANGIRFGISFRY